jgi:hypothetical protein
MEFRRLNSCVHYVGSAARTTRNSFQKSCMSTRSFTSTIVPMQRTKQKQSAQLMQMQGSRILFSSPAAAKTSPTPTHGPSEELDYNDHSWRQQNHIWTSVEITDRMKSGDQVHKPVVFSDYIMKGITSTLYHSFNFITGYKHDNPSAGGIEWRLIILESFAGVPGFVGAAFRHFHSLRTLQHDHGMIFTLLEEAENERMHLLTCMEMFNASKVTKALVVVAQFSMTPFLIGVYLVKPAAVHRFVGYLEETAVQTYSNVVAHVETPGSHLHTAWAHLDAPAIAVEYWQMPVGQRKWIDALKRMLADESHHRDVNHTLASLPPNAKNPFIKEHMDDFTASVERQSEKRAKSRSSEASLMGSLHAHS